jgi:lactoylglutathione lyase
MSPTLDHVMMRVEDLDRSLDWYTGHLGYEEKERHEGDEFTLVYLGPAEMGADGAMLELTYNHDGRSYEMGDAWGHVAVRVEDLYGAYDELMDAGVEDYRDPDSCGGSYAFVTDPDGHEVEIVERDHGARWSLDHTMVRVEDVDEAIGWWVRKMEYENTGRWESEAFANYFLSPRDAGPEAMDVELTYNYDGRTYTAGSAWGHLAVAVDDLHDGWATLEDRHAEAYRPPADCDDLYAFTRDPDGHEVEVVERSGGELFPF